MIHWELNLPHWPKVEGVFAGSIGVRDECVCMWYKRMYVSDVGTTVQIRELHWDHF